MTYLASVQWEPRPGAAHRIRHLGPGERVTFGSCGCGSCGLDIISPLFGGAAGAITAFEHHWRADNLSGKAGLLVEDLEDTAQLIRIPPRRAAVVIPFELARVTLAGTGQPGLLTVFGPEPAAAQARPHACPSIAAAPSAGLLDPGALYFAVLQVLCEPRVTGRADSPLPTSQDIAARLGRRGVRLTPRAVDHHIDYLVRRMDLYPEGGTALRRSWKKEILASAALRRGLLSPAPAAAAAG